MAKKIGEVIAEIRALAQKNKFKEIVKILSDLAHKYEKSPKKLIAVLTMRIYYNIQLNANQSIVSDLNLIKSPYSDKWKYESYPDVNGDRKGSMCPFSLYLMYSFYPYLVGSTYTALDRLHTLWQYLEKELNEGSQPRDLTVSRIIRVRLLVADVLLGEKRYLDAVEVLMQLQQSYAKQDHATNAMLAVLYSQIGDTANAQKHIEIAMELAPPQAEIYRGMYCAVSGDFEGAYSIYNACSTSGVDMEESLLVSACENMLINNAAVSLFYLNRTAASKTTIDSCRHVCKNSRLFKGIMLNAAMLKGLAVDVDTKYAEDDID
ncbi:hypothetical protein, conserved [Babesia bigemina]|uniref:Uncharacterized protein n=1 Tax=Babesia bigemina TaxID=5866 RepID=A0A061DBC3_BABBI|nr:hypothetical protein, conserved [Babesia bigemina]CDR97823.1 hypothetical protein, conserved [Babesia bigemina]|eukprot:XP_012770009.1 hypothetical protein, conserved [Babesia bigemina]